MTEGLIQPTLDREEAERVGQEVESVVDQIASHQLRLASSYARLGGLLREVKNKQHWIPLGYHKFTEFLETVRTRIDRRRSQIYAVLSVAEALLPYMTEEQLETVGISKAHELRRFVLQSGRRPDVQLEDGLSLVDYAIQSNITQARLRVKVNELLHHREEPRGLWFELPGFYATPEERKEIEQFWQIGYQTLQLNGEAEEHENKKQVFLAAVRESVSTWVAEAMNDSAN